MRGSIGSTSNQTSNDEKKLAQVEDDCARMRWCRREEAVRRNRRGGRMGKGPTEDLVRFSMNFFVV